MAFPSIRSSAVTNGTTAGGTNTVNLPATVRAGDTLVVFYKNAGAGVLGFPANWNELVDASPDASVGQIGIAWKKADGSESGTTISVTSVGAGKFAAIARAYRDAADPTLRAPELSTVATGSATNPNATTTTPTGGAKDYLWDTVYFMEGEQTGITTNPSGYTLDQQFANSGTAGAVTTNCTIGAVGRTNNAASEDAGIWAVAGTLDDWSAYTLGVHPAEAVPAPLQTDFERRNPHPVRTIGATLLTIAATLLHSTLAPEGPVGKQLAQPVRLEKAPPAKTWAHSILPSTLAPTNTLRFVPFGDDGAASVGSRDADWATAHDATIGDQLFPASIIASSLKDPFFNDFSLARGFMPFRTYGLGVLPPGAVVLAARIRLYCFDAVAGAADGLDWTVVVGPTTQADHEALVQDDFDQCGAVTNPPELSARVLTSSLVIGEYATYELNAAGLAALASPIARFGLREAHDVVNTSVGNAENTAVFVGGNPLEHGAILEVDYAVIGPFSQHDWPNPAPRPAQLLVTIDTLPDETTSADRPFVTPPPYRPPTPTRQHLEAPPPNLLTSTLFATPEATPPVASLFALPPAARTPGQGWTWRSLITEVTPVAVVAVVDVPPARRLPTLTWLTPPITADQAPLTRFVGELPVRRLPAAQTHVDGRDLGLVDETPAHQTDWPLPVRRLPPALTFVSTPSSLFYDTPTRQTDWPSPARRPVTALTFTQTPTSLYYDTPGRQLDWPNPAPKRALALTHLQGRPLGAVDEPTRFAAAWPNPAAARPRALTWISAARTDAPIALPAGEATYALPTRALVPGLTWTQTRPPFALDLVPAHQTDWPVPTTVRRPVLGHLQASPTLLEPATPTRQTEWPLPVRRPAPALTFVSTPTALFYGTPTRQTDWPVPAPTRRPLTHVGSVPTLLYGPVPAHQTDWPLPVRRQAPALTHVQPRPLVAVDEPTAFAASWPLPVVARPIALTWLNPGLPPTPLPPGAQTFALPTRALVPALTWSASPSASSAPPRIPDMFVEDEAAARPRVTGEAAAQPCIRAQADVRPVVTNETSPSACVTNQAAHRPAIDDETCE